MEKKKISIVTAYPTEGAGSGTLITAQAKTYVEMGHEVHIVTANNNTKFKKIPGVKYHLVPFTGEKEPIEKLDGALPFNFVMFTSHTNSSENFWNISVSQLEAYCKKFKEVFEKHIKTEKPDIFHGQHCWISTALLTDYQIPVVCTIHGTDLMGYERAKETLAEVCKELEKTKSFDISPLFKQTDTIETLSVNSNIIQYVKLLETRAKCEFYIASAEKAARNSKKIFVISKQQAAKFKELFPFAADKVILVRNGCDTTIFHKDDNHNIKEVLENLSSNITTDGKIPTDFDKLAIFVGKFAGFKRVDLVLEASKIYEEEMAKKGIKVLTLIVGDGALAEELKAQQEKLGLKNTHFVGRQDANTIRALHNNADVFLAPSDNEPDGLVYKECMLCNNIPIGTIGGGVPDTINPTDEKLVAIENTEIYPTKYGVLIPMNNSKALADAAMYVMENPNKFNKEEIISYAQKNYDQRNISKNVIIPIFNEVVELPNSN